MRDSLQSPTRGGLKRPQSLRPRGIKDKFPDIKLHGQELGFDPAYVHEATTHEVIYQAVMRTSLRRPDVADAVTIIVPDSHAANRLQALLGGAKVTKIGSIDKPRPLSGTERNQRSKVTKLTQSLFAAKPLRTPLIEEEERHHNAAEIQIPSNPPTCFVTFYENRYATKNAWQPNARLRCA